MVKIPDKTLAIRVDEEFYKKVKFRLAETGLTLKDYFIKLVENDVENSSQTTIEGYTRQEIMEKADEIIRLLQRFANE